MAKNTSSQTLKNGTLTVVSGKSGGQLVPGVSEKPSHSLLGKQKRLTGSVDNEITSDCFGSVILMTQINPELLWEKNCPATKRPGEMQRKIVKGGNSFLFACIELTDFCLAGYLLRTLHL